MTKPQPTVVGAALMVVRAFTGLGVIVIAALNARQFAKGLVLQEVVTGVLPGEPKHLVFTILLSLYGVAMLFYVALAVFVFLGQNWSRIVAMAVATVSITVAFAGYWTNGVEITLRTTLLSLTLDILILLALSSRVAREYARRPR